MATNLDQFGQYLQQLHPHCKNALSQMECRSCLLWASDHRKFSERLINRAPSEKTFEGFFVTQKGLVAVTFTGYPFNHVNAKTWLGTCVAPMCTFVQVWSVTQTSTVQQSIKQTYAEAKRGTNKYCSAKYKTDVRRGQTNLSISFPVARLLTKQQNAPCNLLSVTWHCAVI